MSNERIDAMLEDLKAQTARAVKSSSNQDNAPWNHGDGVIIPAKNAAALLDHIDKLESALEFYADRSNNTGRPTPNGYSYGRAYYDKGDIAREALNK